MMNRQTDIPAELYEDEAVRFLADRYRTTPRIVIWRFLVQDGLVAESEEASDTFRLEDNEMELLRGLINRITSLNKRL